MVVGDSEDAGQPNMHSMESHKPRRWTGEASVSDYVPCWRGKGRRVWWPNSL